MQNAVLEKASVTEAGPDAHAALLLRAIEALEPLKEHEDLVNDLKRSVARPPAAWVIAWLDGLDQRRRAFATKEQALAWLEDRRGFNSELGTATPTPLFAWS